MRSFFRLASVVFLTIFASSSTLLHAQSAKAVAASARLSGGINPSQTVRLEHHVPVYADVTKLSSVTVPASENFNRLTLVMTRAPQVEAAFQQLLEDQLDPSSPRYHQWITAEQVGTLYGPAQSDIDAVSSWLRSSGFTVLGVSPNHLFIDFSGPVAAVTKAFDTDVRTFSLANGEKRYSITKEPSVPAAIAPLVKTIFGLSQTIHHPTLHSGALQPASKLPGASNVAEAKSANPDLYASNGSNFLVSGDFNTIYDVKAAATAGYTGTGQNIAIIGESRVYALDVTTLQGIEALPSKTATEIVPPGGADPGTAEGATTTTTDNGAQDEATLDVNRTNGTAPGAQLDLVISADIGTQTIQQEGLYIAMNYEVNTLKDPIMTISFGGCEALNGASVVSYEDGIFSTGAAAGISIFVSSGDSGAAACNAFYSTIPTTQTLSVNDICVSQWVTCVGGTEFNDPVASVYWGTTNGTGAVTAKSYIPEGAWNEVPTSSPYADYGATGGGVSIYMAKPAYQTGTGVPSGSYRWVPDVAFSSSNHDGYVTCLYYLNAKCGNFYGFGGTSAAAPSMAGVQALTNQKLGVRQGAMNHLIYKLANTTAYATAFHDATIATSGVTGCVTTTPSICNNSTPAQTTVTGGLAGYALTTGYDPATGWGSLDVYNYMTALAAMQTVTVSLTPSTIATGATTVYKATVSGTNGAVPTGTIQFQQGGVNVGTAQTLVGGTSSATASLTSSAYGTAGTYSITAIYSGDTNYAAAVSAAATLTVSTLPAPTVTVALTPTSITQNSTDSFGVTVSGTGATPTGTVQFLSNGVAMGSAQTLVAGHASLTSSAYTTAGTYQITATYTPDVASSTVYASATSAPQTLTVTALPVPTVTVALTPTSIAVGSTDSFSVTVAGSSSTPTGTVQFQSAGTNMGVAQTLVAGKASITSSPYTVTGNYAITAIYTPDTASANVYAAATSTAQTLTVTAIGTTTSITVTSPINAGTTSSFSATVAPVSGTGVPTGTVSFYTVGAPTPLATGTLLNGTVTVNSPVFTTPGSFIISATYTPDTVGALVYTGSSTTLSKTVVVNPVPGFTLTSSGSISVTKGATTGNTAVVTVTSGVLPNFAAGFAGTVSLGCSIVTNVAVAPTCAVSPAAVSVTATAPATATVTITTIADHANKGTQQTIGVLRGFGGATLAGLLILCLPIAGRRRNWKSLIAVLFCAAAFAGLSGCGNNSTPAPVKSGGTTSGTYMVVITGTATGAATQTTSVTLTVQ